MSRSLCGRRWSCFRGKGLYCFQRGRGTYVTGRPVRTQWLKVQTSLADLARSYHDTRPEIVNIDESMARAPLVADDGIPAERYVFMRRIHSQDEQPYCIINIYLDERIFRRHPERFRTETVITISDGHETSGGVFKGTPSC